MQQEQKVSREELKILTITLFIALCGGLGIDIHLPSLPHIMSDLHTNQIHMQQSVSIFIFGLAGSMLFYGPLSDKYGRKPIVLLGLTIASLASFLSVFAKDIDSFLATRLIQGIGMGVCSVLSRAIMADTLPGIRFVLVGSNLSMITSLSPLLAPLLGGYLQAWFGWQTNFIVLGLLLLLALILFALYCPETNQHINPHAFTFRGLHQNYKSLVLHPIFVISTLISGIGMAAGVVYATTSSFIFQTQFHLSPVAYGWITMLVGAGNFCGKFVNSITIQRMGSSRAIFIGLLLLLIVGIWLMLLKFFNMAHVPFIIAAVFVTIFCQTFIMINSTSFAMAPFHDKRGSASALFGCFQMLTAFFSSAIAGGLMLNGVVILAVAYCILGTLGLSIYFSVFSKANNDPSSLIVTPKE